MSLWDKILEHRKSLVFPENKIVWLLSLKREDQSEISQSDYKFVESCRYQQEKKRLSKKQMRILETIYEKYQIRDVRR